MEPRIIRSPNYIEDIDGPVIFLAGPVVGADDWQEKAIKYFQRYYPDLYVASPRRFDTGFEIADFPTDMFNEQVDWESHHLSLAGLNGVILFWLANEAKHYCNRAYAETTRFELGEWVAKHKSGAANLVIGIDCNFSGSRYLRYRLSKEAYDIPLEYTLEATCREAALIARK